MIDFNLEPYEWQKCMSVIMHDVNLSKLEILENAFVQFEFLNSYDGKPHKKVSCHNVWKLSFGTSGIDEFPIFICDVRLLALEDVNIQSAFDFFAYGFGIPDSKEYNLLCLDSGEISISLICEKVEIEILNLPK